MKEKYPRETGAKEAVHSACYSGKRGCLPLEKRDTHIVQLMKSNLRLITEIIAVIRTPARRVEKRRRKKERQSRLPSLFTYLIHLESRALAALNQRKANTNC